MDAVGSTLNSLWSLHGANPLYFFVIAVGILFILNKQSLLTIMHFLIFLDAPVC